MRAGMRARVHAGGTGAVWAYASQSARHRLRRVGTGIPVPAASWERSTSSSIPHRNSDPLKHLSRLVVVIVEHVLNRVDLATRHARRIEYRLHVSRWRLRCPRANRLVQLARMRHSAEIVRHSWVVP
eukprot:scaffold32131_cov26-Tisochrysis_lutea.AAC.3